MASRKSIRSVAPLSEELLRPGQGGAQWSRGWPGEAAHPGPGGGGHSDSETLQSDPPDREHGHEDRCYLLYFNVEH